MARSRTASRERERRRAGSIECPLRPVAGPKPKTPARTHSYQLSETATPEWRDFLERIEAAVANIEDVLALARGNDPSDIMMPPESVDLIQRCLRVDPRRRIDTLTLAAHEWVKVQRPPSPTDVWPPPKQLTDRAT